jgi:hypothetical protein
MSDESSLGYTWAGEIQEILGFIKKCLHAFLFFGLFFNLPMLIKGFKIR